MLPYNLLSYIQFSTIEKSMLVLSTDCIIGREAMVVLANLSGLMAEKMDEPISYIRGCVNGCIIIAIARSY